MNGLDEELALLARSRELPREAAAEPAPPREPDHLSIPAEACRQILHIPVGDGFVLPIYELAGSGTGPIVLFAHGCGFAAGSYLSFLRALASHTRVFAFDARGHGGSGSMHGARPLLGVERFTGDLLTVIETIMDVARRRPYVVGHSFGGSIALRALARRPDRIRGMALLEPSIFPSPDAAERPRAEADIARMIASALSRRHSWRSPHAFTNALPRGAFSKVSPHDRLVHARAVLRRRADTDYRLCCAASTEADVLSAVAADDLWGLLPALHQHVGVVSADPARHDRLWITDSLRELTERLPSATFHAVRGTNHLMPLEQPKLTSEIVMQAFMAAGRRPAAE